MLGLDARAAQRGVVCYLLEADGFRLVVDLGNGAVGALQRRGPSAARCPSRPPARFSTWASEPRGTPVLS